MLKSLERGTAIKERIFRTLLNTPDGSLTKYKLAKLSNCTYPSVHRLVRELEIRNLTRGTNVKKFREMIEIWQKWKFKRITREYLVREPLEFLKNTKLTYALTTYQAENLVQNYLIPSRVDLYVKKEDWVKWHDTFIKHGALVGKGNTKIIMGDEHVFYNTQTIRGLHVVSTPQLIVDLLNEGGVCIEAADNLLEKMNQHAL